LSLTGAVYVPESSSEEEGTGMSDGGMHQPAFARGLRPDLSQKWTSRVKGSVQSGPRVCKDWQNILDEGGWLGRWR
jgi:hypothetical protein